MVGGDVVMNAVVGFSVGVVDCTVTRFVVNSVVGFIVSKFKMKIPVSNFSTETIQNRSRK